MSSAPVDVSVVVPVYANEASLAQLVERITGVLTRTGYRHECILVDDASPDDSWSRITELVERHHTLLGVRLAENIGSTGARAVGNRLANGAVICTLDADLENAPEDLPRLVERVLAGFDLVSAVRTEAAGRSPLLRLGSAVTSRLASSSLRIQLSDLGCGMKAWTSELGRRAAERDPCRGELSFLVTLHREAGSFAEVVTAWRDQGRRSTHRPLRKAAQGLQLLAALRPAATAVTTLAASSLAGWSGLRFRIHGSAANPARPLHLFVALAGSLVGALGWCALALDRRRVRPVITEVLHHDCGRGTEPSRATHRSAH